MFGVLKVIDILDNAGLYRLSDRLQNKFLKLSAFPYNLTSLDELPLQSRQTSWKANEEDYNQYDDLVWKELKWRLPEYRGLNKDKSDSNNMEGEMHGEDAIPGPAYVFPGENPISPSMMGGLEDFTWDAAHDANKGTEEWKNLQPRH